MEGVEKRARLWFKAFEEPPHRLLFAAEIVSPTTVNQDADPRKKPAKYAALGFEEYFLMDPFGHLLRAPIQGFRLVNGRYEPIPRLSSGSVRSETLGLEFAVSSGALTVTDPRTGRVYLPVDDERQRADRVDEENVRLRAENERLRRLLNSE